MIIEDMLTGQFDGVSSSSEVPGSWFLVPGCVKLTVKISLHSA